MTMNSCGPISLAGCTAGQSISKELALSGTAQISLNCSNVRSLAGVPSGVIIMPTNFYGKSSANYWGTVGNVYGEHSAGVFAVGSNTMALFIYNSTTYGIYIYNSSGVFQNKITFSNTNLYAGYPYFSTSDGTYFYFLGLDHTSNQNTVIVKLDSSGTIQYKVYIIPNTTGSAMNAISADSSGNLYIFYGYSTTYFQPYTIKLNSSGTIQYQTAIAASNAATQGYFVNGSVSPNGSYMYAFGYLGSSAYLNIVQLNPSTGAPISGYTYRYTSSTYFSNYSIHAPFLVTSNANNAYIMQWVLANSYIIIAKFAGGNLSSPAWARQLTFGGTSSGTLTPSTLAIDSSENVYVLINNVDDGAFGAKLFLAKYNSSGVLQFQRKIQIYTADAGYIGWSSPASMSIDANNNLYIGLGSVNVFNLVYKTSTSVPTGVYQLNVNTNHYQVIVGQGTLTDSSFSFYSITSISGLSATSTSYSSGTYCTSSSSNSVTTYNTSLNYTSGWGSATFNINGTYTWIAPVGVTKVSVVAIGGGGMGNYVCSPRSTTSGGGGGGGLGYKNNISVTPGCSYTVFVGRGGAIGCATPQDSYFINTSTVKGGKGSCGNTTGCRAAPGGTYTGDGGGNGGAGGKAGGNYSSGGGGTGGYSGTGGAGGNANVSGSYTGQAGSGGAGGGGGGNFVQGYPCGYYGGNGGAVFFIGQGASGVTTTTATAVGKNGSCGAARSGGNCYAGFYGNGGGGGSGYYCQGSCCNPPRCGTINHFGGCGAVRIVWPGCARSFPSTNVGSP